MTGNEIGPLIIWVIFFLVIMTIGVFHIFLVPKRDKDKETNGKTES